MYIKASIYRNAAGRSGCKKAGHSVDTFNQNVQCTRCVVQGAIPLTVWVPFAIQLLADTFLCNIACGSRPKINSHEGQFLLQNDSPAKWLPALLDLLKSALALKDTLTVKTVNEFFLTLLWHKNAKTYQVLVCVLHLCFEVLAPKESFWGTKLPWSYCFSQSLPWPHLATQKPQLKRYIPALPWNAIFGNKKKRGGLPSDSWSAVAQRLQSNRSPSTRVSQPPIGTSITYVVLCTAATFAVKTGPCR